MFWVLLGNGSGGFTYEQSIQSYMNPSHLDLLYLRDLNGDGHPDILVTDPLGADFRVYLGNGNGTFSAATTYNAGTPAGPFLLADVDGDGHPDVVALYYEANAPYQLGYFKGNPDGSFSALTGLGASPVQNQPLVLAQGLTGSGFLDLVFLTPSGLGVCLGKAGPSFGSPLTTISGGSMSPYTNLTTTLQAADFNADGHTDIAMAVEGGIVLLFGNGNGTFASDDFYDMGQPVGSAVVGKFSGSGNLDIAVTLPATFPRLLLGDGKGNFTLGPDPNASYGSQMPAVTILAGDFNGDGKPDVNMGTLVSTTSAITQSVALDQGNGTFSTPVAIPNGSPVMADVNGDGRTDMVYASGTQVISSLGQASGSFLTAATSLRVPFNGGYNVGDVNNDGKPDLVLNYGDHLEIWLGNGDGRFTYFSAIPLQGPQNGGVIVGDVDGDHNADILLLPGSYLESAYGPIAILYGNGNGTFQAPVVLPTTRRFYDVVLADVNQDNLPDLVMTDGATVAVVLNQGNRKFGPESDYVAGRSIQGLNVVDVNSDGYPDIVVSNGDAYLGISGPDFNGTTVVVLLNEPNVTAPSGAAVNGTLTVTPTSPISGQAITITLAVAGQSSGSPTPTGTVSFSVDGVFLADATLANGSASYTDTATLVATQHTITTAYNGDGAYAPTTFSTVITALPPTYATTTSLNASPSTVLASNTIGLTATVTSAVPVPAGVVTFLDGGNTIGSANINSGGVARFDTNLLAPGTHNLTATFQGWTQGGVTGTNVSYVAAIFQPSTSSILPVVITADATTVALSASVPSGTAGTVLTFTAQVGSTVGVPFGSASFYDGTTLLGTLALNSQGQASYSTASLSTGSHSITAAFNANGPYGGAVSAPQNISINAAPAAAIATYVSLALQTDSSGGKWLQATVSSGNPSSSGQVTFLDSGGIIGTAPVNASGVAVLAIPEFASGQHLLTASYGGTSALAPSVSPAFTEQWPSAGPGFSLQVVQQPVKSSSEVSLQVNLLPTGNFQQTVTLSCASGVPTGYRCEFSPTVLSGGHENSTLLILPSSPGTPSLFAGLVFLPLLFAVFLFRAGATNRYWWSSLVLLVCCCVGSLTGCNHSSPYTRLAVVTVQASAGAGSEVIIHSVQLIVKLPSNR